MNLPIYSECEGLAGVAKIVDGQWWPDGLDLGLLLPKLYPKPSGEWPHADNRYTHSPHYMPPSDFPVFTLNVAVVSERAAPVLRHAGLIEDLVPMTVSGAPFFAIQPQQCDAFQPDRSRGLQLAGGQTFFYYSRVFDESRVTGEFFAIPSLEPFSDLFITVYDAVSKGVISFNYVPPEYRRLQAPDPA